LPLSGTSVALAWRRARSPGVHELVPSRTGGAHQRAWAHVTSQRETELDGDLSLAEARLTSSHPGLFLCAVALVLIVPSSVARLRSVGVGRGRSSLISPPVGAPFRERRALVLGRHREIERLHENDLDRLGTLFDELVERLFAIELPDRLTI